MKLFLAILLATFISIEAYGSRVKRGFSEDAIKKMTDALNKDREEILKKTNWPFMPTWSRSDYEKKVEMLDCSRDYSEEHGVPLQMNDVAEELLKKLSNRTSLSVPFFHYAANVFGCSSTYKCRKTVTKYHARTKDTEHLIGKTIMINGMCTTYGDSLSDEKFENKMRTMDLPHPSKYGDLLGVPKPTEENEVGSSAITSSENASAVVNGASLNSFFFLFPFLVVFYI